MDGVGPECLDRRGEPDLGVVGVSPFNYCLRGRVMWVVIGDGVCLLGCLGCRYVIAYLPISLS